MQTANYTKSSPGATFAIKYLILVGGRTDYELVDLNNARRQLPLLVHKHKESIEKKSIRFEIVWLQSR